MLPETKPLPPPADAPGQPAKAARPLSGFAALEDSITAERNAVLTHPIYQEVDDFGPLRVFMASHVFAVWDFMCLLKELQRRLTCVEVPWLPPLDVNAARLMNEIVLGEETDEVTPGRYVSHFKLYADAMEEVAADSSTMHSYIYMLRAGVTPADALAELPLLPSTRAFVLHTLATCQGKTVEVAAAFLLGREDLVPQMFKRLLHRLEASGARCPSFRLYLERHIFVDGEQHGPAARNLLGILCGVDPTRWQEAAAAAARALDARRQLWDGVLAAVRSERAGLAQSTG